MKSVQKICPCENCSWNCSVTKNEDLDAFFKNLTTDLQKSFFFIENLQWLLLQIILSDDVLGKNIFLKTFPHLILGSLILLENEQERVSAISTDLWTSYFVACLPLTAFDTQKCHNKL